MSSLKQFHYFIHIVENGSFSQAAERLYIAQSALSRQIKLLEDDCGFLLFDRTERKIKLTAAGQVLYQNLKNQLLQIQQSIEQAQRIAKGQGRTIRIAHSSSILLSQDKLDAFASLIQHFAIDIELVTLSSEHQIQALEQGKIDIGFIRPPVLHHLDNLMHDAIYHSALFVAVQRQDAFFQNKQSIAVAELKNQKFVATPHLQRGGLSYLAANLCLSHGFQPQPAKLRSRKLKQLDLIAQGFGISIVPEEFKTCLPANVKLIALENIQLLSEVVLCCSHQADALIKQCVTSLKMSLTQLTAKSSLE